MPNHILRSFACMVLIAGLAVGSSIATYAAAAKAGEPLPPETVPMTLALPEKNDNWVYAFDIGFYSLVSGKVVILDVGADTRNVKGMIPAAQFSAFEQSASRDEIYVAETFFSRGTRGEQTDVLTIYKASTVERLGEILLPTGKRFQVVGEKATLRLTGDEKFALVANFTPATSVSVVNLDKREFVGEIDVPGCMMVYPYGKRSFFSLCGDGTLVAVELDRNGKVRKQTRSRKFNDIDNNPLFTKAARIGDTYYFPSFGGDVQIVENKRGKISVDKRWTLNGRNKTTVPAGWQIASADENGNLYVIMRENAVEGDHKSGGSKIWVVDAQSGEVKDILPLEGDVISVEATAAKKPLLLLVNAAMGMEVYDPAAKEKIRDISFDVATPVILQRVQ